MDREEISDAATVFEAERDRLFGLAYRMLSSVADADDVVQEAWFRWEASDRTAVMNPAAFLTTITSRLAIDRLRSAQRRREEYLGPWLPEPLAAARGTDPESTAVMQESVTLGFLAVLERLGPVERAVFLLHDVFGMAYGEVAAVVDRTEENCRQIAKRSRERVQAERPRIPPDEVRDQKLLEAFLVASSLDDVDTLRTVLHEDIVLLSDGGPTVRAARRPIVGVDAVSRFVTSIARNLKGEPTIEITSVNGQAAVLLAVEDDRSVFVIEPDATGTQILRIYAMRNPDKLAAAGI